MAQTHRRYTREFKLETLELARTSGKSIAQIERDLGLSQGLLHYWKRQFTTAALIRGSHRNHL